jgi:hypothetical protein
LRLANFAVAEEQNLDLRVDPSSGVKVLVVSADFIQNIFKIELAADFGRQIIQIAAKQVELLQREQQGFERSKPANAETARQGELLERGRRPRNRGDCGSFSKPVALRYSSRSSFEFAMDGEFFFFAFSFTTAPIRAKV